MNTSAVWTIWFRSTGAFEDFSMECPRCNGVMVQDVFEDLKDDTGSLHFKGWRCLICGEILDPVIEHNRGTHREPLLGRARKKFATQLS